MKIHPPIGVSKFGSICSLIIFVCIAFAPGTALAITDTISGGAMTMNLDANALAAAIDIHYTNTEPSMFLEDFFASPQVDQMTYNDILTTDQQPTRQYPPTGLQYSVNSEFVNNLTGRSNQATTFSFDPGDLTGTASGVIGLDGVGRFRVDTGTLTNRILVGDFTLQYVSANAGLAPGQSGWTLFNHVSFQSEVFDLFNVTTVLSQGALSISGELGLGSGFDHLDGTDGALVGNFSFQTSVVPVPSAVLFFVTGLVGLGIFGKDQRRSGV